MKRLQLKIKRFCKENKLESPIEHRILDLISELGEISKEVLKMSNYGRKKIKIKKEIKQELGDVFFSLINTANYFKVDLEKALSLVLKKYKKRSKKGSIGSEND